MNFKRKALVKLTTLINACIRLNYISDAWKTAEVIMIPKPGKNLNEAESYRPIPLLPIMSKLFEKLKLKHLKPIIAEKHLVPKHQFILMTCQLHRTAPWPRLRTIQQSCQYGRMLKVKSENCDQL
jgi:hypothetical protein